MQKAQGGHSVQGNWRGWYTYMGHTDRFGFEAVFLEKEGALVGNILDDGQLGEADVTGSFSFPSIKFSKIYRNPGHTPVCYQGMMADDGKSMSGYWSIKSNRGTVVGQWTAMRSDDEQFKFDQTQTQEELEQEESKPKTLLSPSRGSR